MKKRDEKKKGKVHELTKTEKNQVPTLAAPQTTERLGRGKEKKKKKIEKIKDGYRIK